MKYLLALIAASAAALAGVGELGRVDPVTAPAAQDAPNTANVIYGVPYAGGTQTNGLGFSSGNSWMIADDFRVTWNRSDLREIELWAIYATSNCTGMRVQLRMNASGGPGDIFWQVTSAPVVHYPTGYSGWGYPFWYTKVTLPEPYYDELTPGTTYWMALQTAGGSGSHYWLCRNNAGGTDYNMCWFSQNNGSSWTSSQAQWGTAYQQFFVLIGLHVALEHETWAEIKASF
jgi:hypothetical protein